jgi:hypothetical protein
MRKVSRIVVILYLLTLSVVTNGTMLLVYTLARYWPGGAGPIAGILMLLVGVSVSLILLTRWSLGYSRTSVEAKHIPHR